MYVNFLYTNHRLWENCTMLSSWLVLVASGGCGVVAILWARWRDPYRESSEVHWYRASSPSKKNSCRDRSDPESCEGKTYILPSTCDTTEYTHMKNHLICKFRINLMNSNRINMEPDKLAQNKAISYPLSKRVLYWTTENNPITAVQKLNWLMFYSVI